MTVRYYGPAAPTTGLARGMRRAHPRRRFAVIWLTALVAAGALVARLVSLQVSPSERLLDEGAKQRLKTIPLQANRGAIVDRNGADLAISVPQTTIAADAQAVVDPIGDAARLAPILQRDQAELQALLSSGKSFVYLARQVDDATAQAVHALKLGYVWTYSEPKRFLPAGDGLGLSVVGRTDIDTNGLSGLELQYDSILKGDSGKLIVEQGKGGRTIPGGEQEVSPARAGDDLVLSIDRGLQFEAEELLKRAVDANGAKGGTVLVSKTNGEILVDANVVRDEGGTARTVAENRAVTWTYEPGSIEKAITMAGVLEEDLATPDTIRFISSNLVVAGRLFEQEHRSVDADLSLTDILKNSDNVGTMTWAQDLGKDKLDKYVRKFGLGSPTGLEFPGESRGKVADVDKWNALSLPTIAIGQGLSVTPMQMLSAYNTIANGGMHVEPRFVLGQESPAGVFTAAKAADPSRVVSPATATALTQMLTKVVTEGTGTKAQVAGYTVAGKTGTAWEPLDGGGYTDIYNHHKLVTSFVGFLPAANPELTILVVLDQPSDPGATGGTVAAPLFRDVASYAVRHLRLPPDAEAAPPGPRDRVRATPQAAPTTTSTTTTTTPSRKGSPVASTKSKAR